MRAYYHSRETFGTVDGKGIRYVLFLAGCSLSCAFCHNPDTWNRGVNTITSEEILSDISKYRRYYEASGGGITISGGEPLLQPEFTAELFRKCKEDGIHTTLDTAGFCPQSSIEQVLPYTDEILFCIKVMDGEKHRQLTAKDNQQILKNFRLAATRVPVIVRYVVIPGINNQPEDIQQLAEFLSALSHPVSVELLAYHTMGLKKWEALGLSYRLADVAPATPMHLDAVREMLKQKQIRVQPSC